MAHRIVRHNDNWKDNPNKYTGLYMIIAPILSGEQRKEFNNQVNLFKEANFGFTPEKAEKIVFLKHLFPDQRLYIQRRIKSEGGAFDRIKKELVNENKIERGLKRLSMWLQVKFKNICKEQGIRFDVEEYGISDIQLGVRKAI